MVSVCCFFRLNDSRHRSSEVSRKNESNRETKSRPVPDYSCSVTMRGVFLRALVVSRTRYYVDSSDSSAGTFAECFLRNESRFVHVLELAFPSKPHAHARTRALFCSYSAITTT